MKKLVLVALMAMVGMGVVVNSCSKEDDSSLSNKKESSNIIIPKEDITVFNNIQKFKKKVDFLKANPAVKSGEMMSVDSAKWYLDASFNLTYSFINEPFEKFDSETFLVSIAKSGENINLNDLSTAFYEMKDKTLAFYNTLEADQKELYASHSEVESNKSDELVLKTTVSIGSKSENYSSTPPVEEGPFEDGDEWKFGQMLGDCSEFGGPYWGSKDAATEIGFNVNNYRETNDDIPGVDIFYTEPSDIAIVDIKEGISDNYANLFINPNDNEVDNYRDYYLLYQDQEDEKEIHICIESDELNFYYNGLIESIYNIIPNNPVSGHWHIHSGLSFYECVMEGIGDGDPMDPDIAHHYVKIMYKKRHIFASSLQPTSIDE